jgi:hypothetical protein
MIKLTLATLTILSMAACSSSASVDPVSAIPGSWKCGDEVVVTFNPDGSYEWLVPPSDAVIAGDAEFVRTNPDGSHALLGKWRLAGKSLELDMLGGTEKYELAFESATSFAMNGLDDYACLKQ